MSTAMLSVPVNERDHITGTLDAPVVLVEYGDYECPHCGRAHSIVKAARQRLGEDLAFVYRHFPLEQIHPNASLAAQAAEAAGAQGKFWPMHDQLFEHQHALHQTHLLVYAGALGLDVARFARELTTGVHARKVRDDFRGGVRSGVNGTPTFFINDVRFDGDWGDAAGFIAVLKQAIRTRPASGRSGA